MLDRQLFIVLFGTNALNTKYFKLNMSGIVMYKKGAFGSGKIFDPYNYYNSRITRTR